ncbi:MAG TPA: class I SAM-dependent methyltransferase [Chitinophagaceae bacterium]|nr:class I SAM-dependent methyltransferase [Chitinophagaceae bacterium]
MIQETITPSKVIKVNNRAIKCFDDLGENIDLTTVQSFGEEWQAFHHFTDAEIKNIGDTYFDIITPEMVGSDKIAADFGCGTGRWSKYFHTKVGAVVAIDPSDAVLAAAQLLEGVENVHLYKASIDKLPFADDYFDIGFSLGVLHHIPDTEKALAACVKKIKPGGHFLVYLYYSLDNRGEVYKALFRLSNLVRIGVSKMPARLKKFYCDLMAIFFYMPFVLFSRLLRWMRVSKKIRSKMPLHAYESTSFYIIRNDALDRFGTPLEQRFSRKQILEMMENAGLENIVFSEQSPFWHAVGQKKK